MFTLWNILQAPGMGCIAVNMAPDIWDNQPGFNCITTVCFASPLTFFPILYESTVTTGWLPSSDLMAAWNRLHMF